MKVVSISLANLKDMEEIQLINCQLNADKCKILAHTLMRMKKLRIFKINDSNPLDKGLETLIYNHSVLTFWCLTSADNLGSSETKINAIIAALYKILKISASIEILKSSSIAELNKNLSKDFWIRLGECQNLQVLAL